MTKNALLFCVLALGACGEKAAPSAPPPSSNSNSAPAAASVPAAALAPKPPPPMDPANPCANAPAANADTRGEGILDGYAKEIIPLLEQMRGAKADKQVAMNFISKREACEYFVAELDRQSTPEEQRGAEEAAKAWGLMPPEADLKAILYPLLTEQVGGFYDPRKDVLFVADFLPRFVQKPVLAHEMYHALQDQRRDLTADLFGEKDEDVKAARSALFEGDGTLVMMFASGTPLPILLSTREAMAKMMRAGGAGMPAFAAAPKALQESLVFPYTAGLLFVLRGAELGGLQKVDEAYTTLPSSTEQILHPDKFFATRDNPSKVSLPEALPIPAGWSPAYENVNGEFALRLVLGAGDPSGTAAQPASGWDGDRYRVYTDGKGGRALVALFTWDDETGAKSFQEALVKAWPGATSSKDKTSFAYARGFGPEDAAIATAAAKGEIALVP